MIEISAIVWRYCSRCHKNKDTMLAYGLKLICKKKTCFKRLILKASKRIKRTINYTMRERKTITNKQITNKQLYKMSF